MNVKYIDSTVCVYIYIYTTNNIFFLSAWPIQRLKEGNTSFSPLSLSSRVVYLPFMSARTFALVVFFKYTSSSSSNRNHLHNFTFWKNSRSMLSIRRRSWCFLFFFFGMTMRLKKRERNCVNVFLLQQVVLNEISSC